MTIGCKRTLDCRTSLQFPKTGPEFGLQPSTGGSWIKRTKTHDVEKVNVFVRQLEHSESRQIEEVQQVLDRKVSAWKEHLKGVDKSEVFSPVSFGSKKWDDHFACVLTQNGDLPDEDETAELVRMCAGPVMNSDALQVLSTSIGADITCDWSRGTSDATAKNLSQNKDLQQGGLVTQVFKKMHSESSDESTTGIMLIAYRRVKPGKGEVLCADCQIQRPAKTEETVLEVEDDQPELNWRGRLLEYLYSETT